MDRPQDARPYYSTEQLCSLAAEHFGFRFRAVRATLDDDTPVTVGYGNTEADAQFRAAVVHGQGVK